MAAYIGHPNLMSQFAISILKFLNLIIEKNKWGNVKRILHRNHTSKITKNAGSVNYKGRKNKNSFSSLLNDYFSSPFPHPYNAPDRPVGKENDNTRDKNKVHKDCKPLRS